MALFAIGALVGFGVLLLRNPDSTNRGEMVMEVIGRKSERVCLVPELPENRQDGVFDSRFCYVPAPDFTEANPKIGDCIVVLIPSPDRLPNYSAHFVRKRPRPCEISDGDLQIAQVKLGVDG